ncbi:uncharacterized protein LOC124808027 [Hydra vulgaris]|uniref:uncharacterized protein LOC124808027 n=1 Tax=Hydra vulgaris TaxID=6087 RepID=UPI001F5EB617|nr:extensin-2-like [Hydra vulgaris]
MEKTPPPPGYYQVTEKDPLYNPQSIGYTSQNPTFYQPQTVTEIDPLYNPQNVGYTSQNPNFYQPQPVPYPSNPQNVGYQTPYYYPNQGTVITNPQTEAIQSFPLYSGPPPDNYSILAWLTCLFCCWPLGLCAIVKSIEVNTAIAEGNLSRAKFASDNAKRFGFMSLCTGIFIHGAWILFLILYLTVFLPKAKSIFNH